MEHKKKKLFAGYSLRERKNFIFNYTTLLLPLAHISVFYFIVNFSAISLAFRDKSMGWSFESIIRVAGSFAQGRDAWGWDPFTMLTKSVTIWFLTHVASNVIAIFTAFILTKHMIGSKIFRVIYYIPGIVGPVVFSAIMKEMYAYNGLIVEICKSLGMTIDPLILKNGLLGNENTAFITLMLQLCIFHITGADMIIGSAFMKIPEEIFESAKIEGCGFFREAFQIAIPLVWPTITTMMVFALCSIFTADYSMYLYSNGSGANGLVSIGFYLYQFQVTISGTTDTNYLYGYVSAFGMFITLITIPTVLLGKWLLSKMNETVEY